MAVVFYCIGTLDLLGMLKERTSENDRESWRDWIWEQQACEVFRGSLRPALCDLTSASGGKSGAGFRPSPHMTAKCSPELVVRWLSLVFYLLKLTFLLTSQKEYSD